MKHIHILITAEDDEKHEASAPMNDAANMVDISMQISPLPSDALSIDEQLSDILLALGFPVSMKGYIYLRESVKLAISCPEYMSCVTKMLYPLIAAQFGCSPGSVERAIRHAIAACWQRGGVERLNELLGFRLVTQADRPSNSELIALIADRIKLGRR